MSSRYCLEYISLFIIVSPCFSLAKPNWQFFTIRACMRGQWQTGPMEFIGQEYYPRGVSLNDFITPFLLQFLSEWKLKQSPTLIFTKTIFEGEFRRSKICCVLSLKLPLLTRLFFFNFQPNPSLIMSCAVRLTRLDLGHIHPNPEIESIPLIQRLVVLFVTPRTPVYLLGILHQHSGFS